MDNEKIKPDISKIEQLAEELLLLADEGDWETFQEKEQYWSSLLRELFHYKQGSLARLHLQDIQRWATLHSELIKKIEHQREAIFRQLKKVRQDQQGIKTYKNM